MLIINKANQRKQFGHGNFKIELTFPGINMNQYNDLGLINLGRFDHAQLKPGAFIAMHKHQNDEILSLLKSGTMLHKDNTGNLIPITKNHLMMMSSGSGIYHEESVPISKYDEDVEMLQIFMRPEIENKSPSVQFANIADGINGEWRLIAGPEISKAPLLIYSDILVYDLEVEIESFDIELPKSPFIDTVYLIYVFRGSFEMIPTGFFSTGDSVIFDGENETNLSITGNSIITAFVMNKEANYTKAGMFSGTK